MRGPNRPKPLSKPELRALLLVNRYRLLTAEQGVRLGLGCHVSQVHALLRSLVNARMVGRTEQLDPDVLSRLPRMHFLKPAGARAIEDATGTPGTASKRRFRTHNEVTHRRGIVDVHIALHTWLASVEGWTLDTFITDFEPGSPGRHKATALHKMREKGVRYPPDAVAHVSGQDGRTRGLLIEFERGGANGDMSRFRREKLPLLRELSGGMPRNPQHEPLVRFIEDQLSGGTFDLAGAVRFVIVFADEARRDRALAKWPDPTSADWRKFFIKALGDLAGDFNGGWWHPDGTQRPLFPVS